MIKKVFPKLLVATLVFLAIGLSLKIIFNVSLADIRGWVLQFGPLAPVAYSVLLFLGLAVPFNPISDFLVVNLAALLFPPSTAVVATFCAHVAALVTNYFVGRRFGMLLLEKYLRPKELIVAKKFMLYLRPRLIFALRFIVPLTSVGVDAVSYIAGSERLKFWKFFLVSIIPWTTINVIYFYSTSYFRQHSIGFFFLPALVLVSVPLIIFSIGHKEDYRKVKQDLD